jgi:hypothetical protein
MIFLSDAELVALTRRTRPTAQRRVLDSLGIPFRLRPDNSIVVLCADLQPAARAQPAPQLRLPHKVAA